MKLLIALSSESDIPSEKLKQTLLILGEAMQAILQLAAVAETWKLNI